MKSLLLIAMLLHPLPQDVLDRRAQVEVFPDQVVVVYQIGAGDEKLRTVYTAATGKDAEGLEPRQLWDELEVHLAQELPEGLKLRIDGQPVELTFASVAPVALHHIRLEFRFVAEYDFDDQPHTIGFVDENFVEHPGFHRVALKGRSGTKVLSANVPLDVRRIEEQDVQAMTPDEYAAARQADATIQVPRPAPWWSSPDAQLILVWVGSVLALVALVGVFRWLRSRPSGETTTSAD